jgi:hypothetical protein
MWARYAHVEGAKEKILVTLPETDIVKIKRLLKAHIHFTSDNIQSIVDTNKKIAQKVVKSQKENIELKKHI